MPRLCVYLLYSEHIPCLYITSSVHLPGFCFKPASVDKDELISFVQFEVSPSVGKKIGMNIFSPQKEQGKAAEPCVKAPNRSLVTCLTQTLHVLFLS